MKIFRKKSEIILRIHSGDQATGASSGSPGVSPSGVISPTREAEYLPRRAQTKKGNLYFYDLGEYFQNGIWIDEQKTIFATIEEIQAYGLGDNLFNYHADQIRAKYNEKPLSVPLENWSSVFRKLSKSDGARLGLYLSDSITGREVLAANDDDWTDDGFLIAGKSEFKDLSFSDGIIRDGEQYKFYFWNVFNFFAYANIFDSGVKITASPSFAAAAFDPQTINLDSNQKINYFVSRRIIFPRYNHIKRVVVFIPLQTKEFRTQSYLNAAYFNFTRRNSFALITTPQKFTGSFHYHAVKYAAQIDGARAFVPEYAFNSDEQLEQTGSHFETPPPTVFSQMQFDENSNVVPISDDEAIIYDVPYTTPPSGSLLSAINQNDNWFFIWRT